MEEQLARIYYDPATGLNSAEKLYQRAKQMGVKVSKTSVIEFLKAQETSQVYQRRRVKHYFPLLSYGPFSRVQIDLADVSQLAHWNRGVKFLFCCVDVFTRFAFVVPMKTKGDAEVLRTFKGIVEQIVELRGFPPVQVDSDQEASFMSRAFSKYCEDSLIFQKLLPLEDYKGTAVVDRHIRTLRELINHYCTAHSTKNYLEVLPELVQNYNTRVNSGIKKAPAEAVKDPEYEKQYWRLIQNRIAKASGAADVGGYGGDFKEGERVRLLLRKKTFEKGTTQRWSSSIHTVEKMEGGLWRVSDRVGGYKPYELQRVEVVQTLPRDGEAVSALEEEAVQVAAAKKFQREMRKEGVEPVAAAPREARVRKPRDIGPYLLQ